MFKQFLHQLGNIENYGVVSICLFVTVFSVAALWAAFRKKPYLQAMGSLPLEDDQAAPQTGKHRHE